MVERLETRGSHPRFVAMMDEYLDAMAIDKAGDVLDMGCGTGVVARAIAKRPKFSGRVIGIDLSAYLAEAAARLSSEEGLAERVRFQTGDTQSLGFEDGAFDAVVAHTLMSHVVISHRSRSNWKTPKTQHNSTRAWSSRSPTNRESCGVCRD
jgi:SAM-dependent methyltransferase